MESYRENLQPALDAGMEHLRTDPRGTGCYCLRQVEVLGPDGRAAPEA